MSFNLNLDEIEKDLAEEQSKLYLEQNQTEDEKPKEDEKPLEPEQEAEQKEEEAQETEQPENDDGEDDDSDEQEDDKDDLEDGDDTKPSKQAKAFQKMRQERKRLKEALEAEREERAKLAERMARLEGRSEAMQPKQQEQAFQDVEPDRDLYPDEWNAWNIRKLNNEIEELRQFRKSQEQNVTYQNELNGVRYYENTYAQKQPDYQKAVDFLADMVKREQKMFNPNVTDAELEGYVQREKVELFRSLHSQGKNPAEVLYQVAKSRGYSPDADKTTPAPKKDLSKVADNMRRSGSLSNGKPSTAKQGVTADEYIDNMSVWDAMNVTDKEFNKMFRGE